MKMSVKSTLIAIAFSASAGNAQVLNEDYKLIASDGAAEDSFGFSVAIEDNIVAVEAFRDDDDNGFNAGSAYLFDTTSTPCSPDLTGDGIFVFLISQHSLMH